MNSDSPLIDSLSVPSLPPLRIHHFMLWTVVSAMMLTVLKTADEGTIGSSFTQTGNIPYLLIESLALCGLVAGLTWKRQGCRFFHQPGHAAMISYGINAIFLVCWATLWMRYGFSNTNGFGRSRFSFLLIYAWYAQLFLQVALSLLFAYQFRAVRRWQSFFLVQALATIIQIACYLFINYWLVSYLSNGSSDNFYWSYIIQASTPLAVETITTLVLVIVVWIDYRQGAQYHWTHWLGVTIWLSMWLSMLVALVWTLMAPPDWLTGQDGWSTFLAE